MAKTDCTLTIGAIYNIIKAGLFVDHNVNIRSERDMRESLEAILKNPQLTNEMWRAFMNFGTAVIELRNSNIGLGGRVQR